MSGNFNFTTTAPTIRPSTTTTPTAMPTTVPVGTASFGGASPADGAVVVVSFVEEFAGESVFVPLASVVDDSLGGGVVAVDDVNAALVVPESVAVALRGAVDVVVDVNVVVTAVVVAVSVVLGVALAVMVVEVMVFVLVMVAESVVVDVLVTGSGGRSDSVDSIVHVSPDDDVVYATSCRFPVSSAAVGV